MRSMEGRAAVVTGAGGFIGGHLVAALVRGGGRVRAFVRYNSRNDRGTLDWFPAELTRDVEVVLGDLRDVESVARAVRDVEVVFHLGAQIAIPYSYVSPRDFVETNVLGSLNLAQASMDAGVQQVVHVSTSEVYGTAQSIPITEAHPLEAQSPYSASKIGADKIMDSYHRSYGLPVTVVRPFNTYGPHQSARAIIPTIVSQALVSQRLHLGSLDPRRDLTYVDDTAAGMIAAAAHPDSIGRTIHLGTGVDVSIGEIVKLVGDLTGKDLEVELDPQRVRPANSEVARLVSDPTRAGELMGWSARVSLRDGLARTIEYIRMNPGRYRVGEYVT